MKGEYVDHHKNHESPNNMFSKLQPHPYHHPHPHHHQPFQLQPLHHHQFHHQSFPFQMSRESQTPPEDEDTSRSSGGGHATPQPVPNVVAAAVTPKSSREQHDGASIEVSRRPRGRPPGSKNKPKPPVVITREPEPVMSPYVLEIPAGSDVVRSLSKFCHRKGIGLCVLSGSGSVVNVTLRQPATTRGSTVTFHGRFDILSLDATFLPPQTTSSLQLPHSAMNIAVSLSGPQGQIFGGSVVGALMTAGVVYVVAASFNSPTYNRLADQEEMEPSNNTMNNNNNVSGGVVSGNEGQSPQDVSGGDGESCGGGGGVVPMYSHLASDVIWAPTAARPPQQPGAPPSF